MVPWHCADTPALTFSKLTQAVSVGSIRHLWPLLANMTLRQAGQRRLQGQHGGRQLLRLGPLPVPRQPPRLPAHLDHCAHQP